MKVQNCTVEENLLASQSPPEYKVTLEEFEASGIH